MGVGGGLIIVPALVFILTSQGLADTVIVHLAIGTSLATIALTSLSSVTAHHRHGAVQWAVFRRLTPGIVIGALLGAAIAAALPSSALRTVFGVFALAVALQLALDRKPKPHRGLPGTIGMTLVGVVIGAVSGIVGIGGGTLTVPFLVWCNVLMRQAVATSAACGFPIAVAGALGFMLMGWNQAALPPAATGYVYWPAFAGIALTSILFAPLGAKLTHSLPVPVLRRFFALFLAVLGVKMLWG